MHTASTLHVLAEGGTTTAPTPVNFRGRASELRHHRRTTSSTIPERQKARKPLKPFGIAVRQARQSSERGFHDDATFSVTGKKDGASPGSSGCCLPQARSESAGWDKSRKRTEISGALGQAQHTTRLCMKTVNVGNASHYSSPLPDGYAAMPSPLMLSVIAR